ncbi:hypothetical protein V8C26DRAFT_388696 [Trichoderma gracile]
MYVCMLFSSPFAVWSPCRCIASHLSQLHACSTPLFFGPSWDSGHSPGNMSDQDQDQDWLVLFVFRVITLYSHFKGAKSYYYAVRV